MRLAGGRVARLLARRLSVGAALQRDGAVWPVPVMPAAAATKLRERLLLELSGLEAIDWKRSDLLYYKAHLVFSAVDELARHPSVIAAAQQALSTDDLLLWDASVPIKPAAAPGAVAQHFPWHQDCTYWGLQPAAGAVSCWVALSDASPAHGCMSVVLNSHAAGQVPHTLLPDEPGSMLRRGQQVQGVDHGAGTAMALQAGQMSMHHPLALHCSGQNTTSEPRVGVVLVFVPPTTVPNGRTGTATLVAGQCHADHWELSSWRPSATAGARAAFDRDSLSAHRAALESHRGDLQARQ